MTWFALEPLDAFIPRGNRTFGGGVHGEAVMPPWPSVLAGALVSRILVDAGRIPQLVSRPDSAEGVLEEVLGPDHGVLGLGLFAEKTPVFLLPADCVVFKGPRLVRVVPRSLHGFPGVASSSPTALIPVLSDATREKPEGGYWITLEGLAQYLSGREVAAEHLKNATSLWRLDQRLGIALDRASRTVREGLLYTTDAVVFTPGVRLLVGFRADYAPPQGLVRLGADGRGAQVEPLAGPLSERLDRLGAPGSGWPGFRMVLATPGLFPHGWLPPGVGDDGIFRFRGVKARLEAAAVGRFQVVSGWDLARQHPKPAERAVPQGSVYWFRVLEGDARELEPLCVHGLWPLRVEDRARRREGFNRVWFGYWDPKEV